jgi:flagellar hook-associated protein 2
MSSSAIDTTGGLTSTSTLTNDGASGDLQITGLASGINTNEIIQAELAEQELPMTNMESEINGLQNENSTLSGISSSLNLVLIDAQTIGSPTMFFDSQSVTSSDPSVSATATGSAGAVIGSTTVAVTQLASAAQRTFNFTSPTSADTVSIDGQNLSLAAGSTTADLADAINSSNTLDVWASATNSGQIVLSSRTTGDNGPDYIQVSDTTGSLVENTALAQNGADAAYSLNGGATQYSTTDTVANALPGVTLSLNAVTPTTTPATITVSPPGPDVSSIVQSIQQFVSDYNNSLSSIESTVNTAPASESQSSDYNPNSGSLFGDDELESLLGDMRETMVQPGAGLPAAMASLADIGISTGSSNGSLNETAISGQLTVNTSQLEQALETNPNGVQAVLQAWATNFGNVVNNEAGPGGALETRMNGDDSEITVLQNQYASLQTMFTQQESDMEEQWASVEGTLSELKGQSTTLSSFASASSSSSSSSSS